MPHMTGECRYCGVTLDKRGLTPHEMSHPQFKPRAKTMTTPPKTSRLEATRERVRNSMQERAARGSKATRQAMATVYPATPPEIHKDEQVVEPPQAPPEVAAMLTGRIRVPKDLINEAMRVFPMDPLLFNIYCYFMAPTTSVVEQIINLKTVMQFVDLKVQQLGGWTEEEMTG